MPGWRTRSGWLPGRANGFTLDLIACLERFGGLIDWAMIILSPMEPWPGELVLDAAAAHRVGLITRVVDYGGIFHGDVTRAEDFGEHDHRRFRPGGWVADGLERLAAMRPYAERHGLTPLQLACAWNLGQPAVRCVAPTLIQERGPGARPIEDKRAELAALGGPPRHRPAAQRAGAAAIRAIGDNTGCMALKGSSPTHDGPAGPDRWRLDSELSAVGGPLGHRPPAPARARLERGLCSCRAPSRSSSSARSRCR